MDSTDGDSGDPTLERDALTRFWQPYRREQGTIEFVVIVLACYLLAMLLGC
ncbi:MAG: hypothetical protein OXN89_22740 [Bryobacterales bacterium]|nr:hypothetical protein [Bryobacterales bacterium]